MDLAHIEQVYRNADCLYTEEQVQAALDQMATQIHACLADTNPLVLAVMSGALIPAGHLLSRLDFPLQLDYIHATRYQGATRGGSIHWRVEPSCELQGRTILIIDDIFDEGITLRDIVAYCAERGAQAVYTAVLVDKLHDRKVDLQVDFIGLQTPDRYLFGYGMDYHNYLRNAAGIYAVKD